MVMNYGSQTLSFIYTVPVILHNARLFIVEIYNHETK